MPPGPARMTMKWLAPPGEMRAITTALQEQMSATRAQTGCTGCSLSTEMGERVVIHYVEIWQSEDHLKRQLRSDRFGALAELAERSCERPIVQFDVDGVISGLEYAEEIRLSTKH